MKLMENWFFEYKPKLHPKIFPNSLESWKIGIFEVVLISYLLNCEDSLAGKVCF